MKILELLTENKAGVIIALLLMVLGTFAYFINPPAADTMNLTGATGSADALRDIRLKVLSEEPGQFDIYVFASPNALAKYRASEGKPIPEKNGIVFGSTEAMMMKKEKVFGKLGDKITEVPGLELSVSGVLAPTGLAIDQMHFVSESMFAAIKAESGQAFVRFSPEGQPKLFYHLGINDTKPTNWTLAEGSWTDYQMGKLGSSNYYPLVLGDDEAKMMREEKLFSKTGDTMRGFFGVDVVVVGVLNKTGTPLDRMHISPAGANELK